jgi:PPOX class probable F420-dependent enzyme
LADIAVARTAPGGDDPAVRRREGGVDPVSVSQLDPQIRAFLEGRRFAVLGTVNADGSVQQTVMWYELRDDHVMMNTRRGRVKDRNLLRDPRVSICVEDGQRFVTIAGRIEFVEDQATAQADIKALAIRYDGPESGKEQARTTFSHQQRVTLLLPIERVITHGFDE